MRSGYNPLVSVIVLAYNSEQFIKQTLDSVLGQSYPHLELIIADDASTDNTAMIASEWLAANGHNFNKHVLAKNVTNRGIAGNCNHGLSHANGDWIKLIAADDELLPSCIEDNVRFAARDPGVAVIFSRMNVIDVKGNAFEEYFFPERFFRFDSSRQLRAILHRNCLPAPSGFIKKTALDTCGGFDVAFPMMEDLPLWVKFLEKGYRLDGMNCVTVLYRVHDNSVQAKTSKGKTRYLQCNKDFDSLVRLPVAKRQSVLLYWTVRVDILIDRLVAWSMGSIFMVVFYPLFWAWSRFSPYTISRRPMQ